MVRRERLRWGFLKLGWGLGRSGRRMGWLESFTFSGSPSLKDVGKLTSSAGSLAQSLTGHFPYRLSTVFIDPAQRAGHDGGQIFWYSGFIDSESALVL